VESEFSILAFRLEIKLSLFDIFMDKSMALHSGPVFEYFRSVSRMVLIIKSNSLAFCSIPAGKSLSITGQKFSHTCHCVSSNQTPKTTPALTVGISDSLLRFLVLSQFLLHCFVSSIWKDIHTLAFSQISEDLHINGNNAPTLKLTTCFPASSFLNFSLLIPAHIPAPFSHNQNVMLGITLSSIYAFMASYISFSFLDQSGL